MLLQTVSATSHWRDNVQVIPWIASAVAVLATIIKSWSESKLSRDQRARDLRWKQAEAAKSLNGEMMNDAMSTDARFMLDFPGKPIEIPATKSKIPIQKADIRLALSIEHEPTEEVHPYIQRCFDNLFYYLSTMEHYIATTLILPDDVKFPLDYYLPLLDEYQPEVSRYLARYRLHRAAAFLERCRSWSTKISR